MNTEVICVVILILCINTDATRYDIPINCHLQPDKGLCRAAIPRYYYNISTYKCKLFLYGGCLGNGNNFESLQECSDHCSAENLDDLPKPSGKNSQNW
ncbi:kappaPI-actitoxin-Avd3b-like [Centruroides sculpturatus]|uniref:kappaPI-actitoxin-Avd3b-like n=1 Tax=Centruroides sculpturatus TaxID=218467 RepID=UPI000C6E225E|nr:kappaPI-actitoxin-Avd3b-like [Centruroides sculpturatus]